MKRYQIICHPSPGDNSAVPEIRFLPNEGWNIQHGSAKGCWGIRGGGLNEAVRDYNTVCQRAVERLNLVSIEPRFVDITQCRGWVEAEAAALAAGQGKTITLDGDFERDRQHAAILGVTLEPGQCLDVDLGLCAGEVDNIRGTARAVEAQPEGQRKRRSGGLKGIMPLVALAAAMGAFEDEDFDNVTNGPPPSKEMCDMLFGSGVAHPHPQGIVLSMPRNLGQQFADDLEKAVREGNETSVRVLLTSAGLLNA